METVEIIVYFVVSIIIGTTFLYFLGSYDIESAYDGMRDLFSPDQPQSFDEVTLDGFTQRVYSHWQTCRFGRDNQNMTVFVEGDELNKSTMFNRYKKINLCDSISSASQGCGQGEDITFSQGPITLPSVVAVTCNASGITIS